MGLDELLFIAISDGTQIKLLFPETTLEDKIDLLDARTLVGTRVEAFLGGQEFPEEGVDLEELFNSLNYNMLANVSIHENYPSFEDAVIGAREALTFPMYGTHDEADEFLYELYDPRFPDPDRDQKD
jgi:hypothetical protein